MMLLSSRYGVATGLILFFGAFATGCSNRTASTAKAPVGKAAPLAASTTVIIGYLANIVMPQPLVGLQDGEFNKLVPGAKFQGQDYPAGPAVLEALRAGRCDIAYTGPYPPIKAFAKYGDIVLLAGAATGGTELMVSKASSIHSVKDLKGKVIGINQTGSTVDAVVRYDLLQAGLNPASDVRLMEVAPALQADALKSGQVAAVAAPAPWPSVVESVGHGRPLLDWKQILGNGKYLAGVAFTTTKFATAHPDLIKSFVAAHRAITDRLNKDRTKGNAEVLAAWSKVSRKTLPSSIAKAAFATIEFTAEVDPQGLQRDADIAVQVGILKHKTDLTGFLYHEK